MGVSYFECTPLWFSRETNGKTEIHFGPPEKIRHRQMIPFDDEAPNARHAMHFCCPPKGPPFTSCPHYVDPSASKNKHVPNGNKFSCDGSDNLPEQLHYRHDAGLLDRTCVHGWSLLHIPSRMQSNKQATSSRHAKQVPDHCSPCNNTFKHRLLSIADQSAQTFRTPYSVPWKLTEVAINAPSLGLSVHLPCSGVTGLPFDLQFAKRRSAYSKSHVLPFARPGYVSNRDSPKCGFPFNPI